MTDCVISAESAGDRKSYDGPSTSCETETGSDVDRLDDIDSDDTDLSDIVFEPASSKPSSPG